MDLRVTLFLLVVACGGEALRATDASPDVADARADALDPDGADATASDASRPDAAPSCSLAESGPIAADHDGQVIEYLRVTSTSGPAITVAGFDDVTIRNCEVRHQGGPGIEVSGASGVRIENVAVEHTGAPSSGANDGDDRNNIEAYSAQNLRIDRVRLSRGSSGVYMVESSSAHLSFVEGHDFRGPFPRGQLAQFDKSDDCILEDFSAENPATTSWVEDNVSVYRSSNCTIRRGLLDGNNSPSGVGVMFELSGGIGAGGLCEDVDAIRMGNGCFSGYPASGVTFRRTRCRENICTDQGRGAPLSGGLGWAGSPESSELRIETSSYYDLCHSLVWDESVFTEIDLTEADFAPREPVRLQFCWER